MSKIIDAEVLAELRAWSVRFLQGRSPEEVERIKDFLQVAFPPRAPAAPDAARSKRKGK